MTTKITTATGRIVWGNPFAGKPIFDDNRQPVLDKAGKQAIEFSFGLAIPKAQIDDIVAPSTVRF